MRKFAFHLGINTYSPAYYGEGVSLDKCVKDSERMMEISRAKGFDYVMHLTDDNAQAETWEAVVLKIAEQANRGDVVFLTQSSHGTYTTETPNGKRATGLCFHDRVVFDFEVREVLKKFRAGVLVVWAADACYAESNWRRIIPGLTGANLFGKSRFVRVNSGLIEPTQGDKRNIRCTFLSYSAAGHMQEAYEDDRGGVFTEAIMSALGNEAGLSYYQLARRAAELIANNYPQTPVFETVRAAAYTGSPFLTNQKSLPPKKNKA